MTKTAPPPTGEFLLPPRHVLLRYRRGLLVLYLLAVAAWVYGMMFGGVLHDLKPGSSDAGGLAIVAIIFLVMPVLFLCGAPHWRWPVAMKPRSVYTSLAAGALMAAL